MSPPQPSDTGLRTSKGETLSLIPQALALGWLLLPAIQYFAAWQRTMIQMGGSAPFEALALLDLTPQYLILLLLTVLYGIWQALGVRRWALGTKDGT